MHKSQRKLVVVDGQNIGYGLKNKYKIDTCKLDIEYFLKASQLVVEFYERLSCDVGQLT